MFWLEYDKSNLKKIIDPQWILIYSTINSVNKDVLTSLTDKFTNTPIFGATSFKGVFTPDGFKEGCFLLVGEKSDNVKVSTSMRECSFNNSKEKAIEAATELKNKLGKNPSFILVHPTPGLEEKVIEGINSVFNSEVAIYGGSAADNDISGKWFIFDSDKIINEGFVIAGYSSENPSYGSFISGYLPTQNKGKVTKVDNRIIYEIDNKPATEVYNQWSGGIIDKYLTSGGVILGDTTLKPIGKLVNMKGSLPQYVISHPHEVHPDKKAISFFTEFNKGDEITLMFGSKVALIKRVEQTVNQAIKNKQSEVNGGILIYCAGCVGVISDKLDQVSEDFKKASGNIPFLGAATFGEQGCFNFNETKKENLHGNLMCCSVFA